ncbi:DUF362 domain-containing protein [Dictyoglomus thermophilum]|uniref:Iron-sulfur cluster-binding protein n=2 Tax=Dictyoglomus thermophilum TaxID=14 RepID=B5YAF2_DICT6|nr:DUF362 domain-containing protein [Dictyoglomus thermophilum]ACI19171.1 iron-sulfur cluster-binding protein [Dictyoglomus thermophilum H-6-12]MCX7720476.1 DUF362 domain-containing protein [Dictyoglomus thermophilum]TYT24390.1 DUF362 domain-containing protein [Dictyoglomus thermophilum]
MKAPLYFVSMRATNENESLVRKIKRLTKKLIEGRLEKGDIVAIKLTFGEPGNHAFIRPIFVRQAVEAVRELGGKPFLTDANTLYKGGRANAVDHLESAIYNGFGYSSVGAPLIIADGINGDYYKEVEVNLKHFKKVKVAGAIYDADFLLVLTHVKGHMSTGLGGAIKNVGMGCAPRSGKQMQHAQFKPNPNPNLCIGCRRCVTHCPTGALEMVNKKSVLTRPDLCIGCGECAVVCPTSAIKILWNESAIGLQEKMAEFTYGILKQKEPKYAFINFVMDVSPDCDCAGWHDANLVPDVGILGGWDIVAIDQASSDLINNQIGLSNTALKSGFNPGEDKLRAVHPNIDWSWQLKYAEEIGLGKREYELIKF